MPRFTRTLRRLARPALAVVLVFAQAVAAFGFPVMRSKVGVAKACGCVVTCGTTPDCCCAVPHAPPPPPPPPAPRCPHCVVEAEPEPPPACPKCKGKEAAKPACHHCTPTAPAPADGVTWVAAWKARQCRGEGPAGLLAEIPAVPPVVPASTRPRPTPAAFAPPADTGRAHFATDPSDPPPRG
ncbi:MAG TPA: hypothetical protein VH092_15730 [Urbifossiella sp.]|jgi:hypothetical protein|nr:hypothetical protein [Urbifossiella sp.]